MKYSHLIVTECDLVRKACVRDIGSGNIPIKDIMSTLPLVAIDPRSPVETPSGTKLASLNNMVGVFEAEIDTNGNFSEKVWEWK